MTDIKSMNLAEMTAYLMENGFEKFRSKQVLNWIKQDATSFDDMKNIPLEKQSKKNRRKFHSMKRGSWNGLNPITRMPANPKAYNRAKMKQRSFKMGNEE